MNGRRIGSLGVILLALGVVGCATFAVPSQITGSWLVGVWSGESAGGWRYSLTVGPDGHFSQVVKPAGDGPCTQTGALWVTSERLHTRFDHNGCNEDFVGVTEAFPLRAIASDTFVVYRPGAELRLRRVR